MPKKKAAGNKRKVLGDLIGVKKPDDKRPKIKDSNAAAANSAATEDAKHSALNNEAVLLATQHAARGYSFDERIKDLETKAEDFQNACLIEFDKLQPLVQQIEEIAAKNAKKCAHDVGELLIQDADKFEEEKQHFDKLFADNKSDWNNFFIKRVFPVYKKSGESELQLIKNILPKDDKCVDAKTNIDPKAQQIKADVSSKKTKAKVKKLNQDFFENFNDEKLEELTWPQEPQNSNLKAIYKKLGALVFYMDFYPNIVVEILANQDAKLLVNVDEKLPEKLPNVDYVQQRYGSNFVKIYIANLNEKFQKAKAEREFEEAEAKRMVDAEKEAIKKSAEAGELSPDFLTKANELKTEGQIYRSSVYDREVKRIFNAATTDIIEHVKNRALQLAKVYVKQNINAQQAFDLLVPSYGKCYFRNFEGLYNSIREEEVRVLREHAEKHAVETAEQLLREGKPLYDKIYFIIQKNRYGDVVFEHFYTQYKNKYNLLKALKAEELGKMRGRKLALAGQTFENIFNKQYELINKEALDEAQQFSRELRARYESVLRTSFNEVKSWPAQKKAYDFLITGKSKSELITAILNNKLEQYLAEALDVYNGVILPQFLVAAASSASGSTDPLPFHSAVYSTLTGVPLATLMAQFGIHLAPNPLPSLMSFSPGQTAPLPTALLSIAVQHTIPSATQGAAPAAGKTLSLAPGLPYPNPGK